MYVWVGFFRIQVYILSKRDSLTLELFELPQVVHPVTLSWHRELFELLHTLITVLYTQTLILASKLPQFLLFPQFDAMVLNEIKNMRPFCTGSWGYSVMGSAVSKVFLF